MGYERLAHWGKERYLNVYPGIVVLPEVETPFDEFQVLRNNHRVNGDLYYYCQYGARTYAKKINSNIKLLKKDIKRWLT